MKFAIKHVNVIPSKKVRDVVKKYGGKIIKAIDTYTCYDIVKALTKVGIPYKYCRFNCRFFSNIYFIII